jgi:hypothetical protein
VAGFTSLRDVLRFERQVVARLTTTKDPERRQEIAGFVDGALRSMPEHLRAALVAASVGLGGVSLLLGSGRPSVHALDSSPIPQLRQYVRVFRSLVLFAEQELPSTSVLVPAKT